CNPTGYGVPSSLVSNAFYNPYAPGIYVCGGFGVGNLSEFRLAQAIGHELAHSIDPCNLASGPRDFSFHYKGKTLKEAQEEYPVHGLLKCLRGLRSVGALPIDVTSNSQTSNPQAGKRRGSDTSDDSDPPPFDGFCNKSEQINEAT